VSKVSLPSPLAPDEEVEVEDEDVDVDELEVLDDVDEDELLDVVPLEVLDVVVAGAPPAPVSATLLPHPIATPSATKQTDVPMPANRIMAPSRNGRHDNEAQGLPPAANLPRPPPRAPVPCAGAPAYPCSGSMGVTIKYCQA